MPALFLPVVDMLLKDDDVGVGNGLFLLECGQELVGGRAAGAAFRGEEFDEDGIEVATGECGGASCGDGAGYVLTVDRGLSERENDLGRLRGLGDRVDGLVRIAAEELRLAVDDHLRGVGVVELQARSVEVLALCEQRGGEAIVPALFLPVIDVLLENDDVGVGDGLLLLECSQELIGTRAAGAALGGEQFYQNRRAALWGGGLSREGERQEQQ